MRSDTKVTVHWPRCSEHDVPLVLNPAVQVGSPWACAICGAVDISEDTQP